MPIERTARLRSSASTPDDATFEHMHPARRSETDQLDEGRVGWECARLLAMAHTAQARAADLAERLAAFDPATLHEEAGVLLSSSELERIADAVLTLEDGVDVMLLVATQLRGRDAALVVTGEEVSTAAARALASGSADYAFVALAASMLTPADGYPALAEALTVDHVLIAAWTDVSADDLLCAFRDSDPARARRLCREALVHPDTPVASLDPDAIERLARTLRATDA